MSKFGLIDEEEPTPAGSTFASRLTTFPTVRPRQGVDIGAIDAAAVPHGFISRESTSLPASELRGRRRRAIPSEPSRHLAIRLTESGYKRFVAYADRYRLTYHDALYSLLDRAGE